MANSYTEYSEIIEITKNLSNKKEEYLKNFKNKPEYALLDELYKKLPCYYNKFAISILNAPLATRKPISPDTAGIIGTVIGGTAVGIVSALNAKEKEEQYRQNAKKVIQSQIEIGSAYEQLFKCCSCIEAILKTQDTTRNDWEKIRYPIRADINRKQKPQINGMVIFIMIYVGIIVLVIILQSIIR